FVKFKKDFSTFNELLLKTKTQLGTIQNTIEQATKRTEIIGKRLEKVETENADLLEGETEDRA
ncbi:MAG TPA: DNA recombination protein RmuC, partial [Clostridiales bacterium]|nr:DNA recombination protein RmuC [Clostridiales bacterium]